MESSVYEFTKTYLENNPTFVEDRISRLYFGCNIALVLILIILGIILLWFGILKISKYFHNKKVDKIQEESKKEYLENNKIVKNYDMTRFINFKSPSKWYYMYDIPTSDGFTIFSIVGGVIAFISLLIIINNCTMITDIANDPIIYYANELARELK